MPETNPQLDDVSSSGASAPLQTVPLDQGTVPIPEITLPVRLGRYRITARLGSGSFGVVYQGFDDQLNREVAIKVPHARRVASAEDVDAYLTEARMLASLDHAGIVPIYDVGRTEDGVCYLISKLIKGINLAARLKQERKIPQDVVEIIARVAEALHHAHQRGLVHRDIKPANILLDHQGQAVVADFGLALRDEDFGKGNGYAGTPAYMSPEQARGEGHRVDARTDIYSLGIVLYELLTGRLPFSAEGLPDLLESIKTQDPRPPRQLDGTVPKELDRICLKALSKRASDRYSTAQDLADDLRLWQTEQAGTWIAPAPPAAPASNERSTLDLDQLFIKIVPRGLRSFDAADADFFLELLPGPRNREGLPDSIRFWKAFVETSDASPNRAVGLLYGPSGCGKSSLVKAGLLPRLAGRVLAVYIEAAADETETRLLNGLRRRCPELPHDLGLVETLAYLRRGHGLPSRQKVLLILDQFEQWLHAHQKERDAELVRALRQCDGERVQAVVLVRDDFWLAVSRFLHDVEIRLVEAHNAMLVDLFDPMHARKVLADFGRAFGRLPDHLGQLSTEQERFLDQAVCGLAQDGKVIPVRLSLFAEMVKGKPWTLATLKEMGGTAGIGVTFLEETFSARTAPPEHRLHKKAVRAVLKALLPEPGTDLKGHMRSRGELLAVSGYADQPKEFDDLLRILDAELRLVTPVDPEGLLAGSSSPPMPSQGDRQYQLTHDYLVPSLCDWLTRKQRETRHGRAELLLAERTGLWDVQNERRHLPTLGEWLRIRLFTRKRDWTFKQRRMMALARNFYLCMTIVLVEVLVTVAWCHQEYLGQARVYLLLTELMAVETRDVPHVVERFEPYRKWYRNWSDGILREQESNPNLQDPRIRLRLSLALLPADPDQTEYLYERMLTAGPDELLVIRDALKMHSSELIEQLWLVLGSPENDRHQRLRAACALAAYDPHGPRWNQVRAAVADQLVRQDLLLMGQWAEALRPVSAHLIEPLQTIALDLQRPESERSLAAKILANYTRKHP